MKKKQPLSRQELAALVGGIAALAVGAVLFQLLPPTMLWPVLAAGFATYLAVAWAVLRFDGDAAAREGRRDRR